MQCEQPLVAERPFGAATFGALASVTCSPDGGLVHHFPRLAICGRIDVLDAMFTIRSYASDGRLADSLNELVADFAAGLKFSGEAAAS